MTKFIQHSNFQASKLFINVLLQVSCVPGPTWKFWCLESRVPLKGSRVPLDHIGVPGPGSHLWGPGFRVPPKGPASRVSGPTFPVCRTLLWSCKWCFKLHWFLKKWMLYVLWYLTWIDPKEVALKFYNMCPTSCESYSTPETLFESINQ